MRDIRTKNIFLISLLAALIMLLLPHSSFASVEIKAVPGLAGLYKQYQPVEITVTVHNDGPAMNAVLQVRESEANRQPGNYYSVYRKSLNIPGYKNYITKIAIPGEMASIAPDLELRVKKKLLAKTRVQGTVVSDGGKVVLTLGENVLQGGFVGQLEKTYGSNLTVKYLPPRELPQTYYALSGADIIVVDRAPAEQLSEEQSKTIQEWVKLGGCLIVSGGVGIETKDIKWKSELAQQKVGRGLVIYSRAELGQIPSSNNVFWENFSRQLNGSISKADTVGVRYLNDNMHGGLFSQASSYLPQLKFPSITGLTVFWLIYLLVIGPLTYIILKRLDRRDWAWLVIPVLGLAAAVGVFLISPSHKVPTPLGQTLAIVDVIDDQLSEVRGAGTFVTLKGGLVRVTSPSGAVVVPVDRQEGRVSNVPVNVDLKSNSQDVLFNNVEYWSMRQSVIYTLWDHFGQLEGDLHWEGDRLVGTLINKTPTDLRDCSLRLAQRQIFIGQLNAGQKLQISESLNKWPLTQPFGEGKNEYKFPASQGKELHTVREDQMLSSLGTTNTTANVEFIGWSDRPTSLFKLEGVSSTRQQTDLTLVRQILPLRLPAGKVINLPPGIIPGRVVDGGFVQQPGGIVVKKGQVTVEYDFSALINDSKLSVQVVNIDIPVRLSQQYGLEIFNWKDNTWQKLTPEQYILSSKVLNSYLSPGKLFRIKLLPDIAQPGEQVLLPALAVKGVVQ